MEKRTYFHLPHKAIKKATCEGWETSLFYLSQLYCIHKHPVFYNYSIRGLAMLLNCSASTLSVHIKILRQKGFISVKNGNLHLIGRKHLQGRYKQRLTKIPLYATKQDQITYFRFILAKDNLDRQQRKIQLKKNIVKMHTSQRTAHKEAKRLLKAEKTMRSKGIDVATSINENLMLTNKKLGALCSRSQRTAIKIQKQFNSLGLVKTCRNMQFVQSGLNKRAFFEKYYLGKYLLSKSGNVFVSLPNIWQLPCAS